MGIVNGYSAQYLIEQVALAITQPYSEWKIGVCSNAKIDSEGNMSLTVFNPENSQAVVAAYKHFKALGVIAIEPYYADAKYLYLYNINAVKLDYYSPF